MFLLEYTVLLTGGFVAAVISGSAGFGGALLLLPLLTRVVGVAAAVPLLTIAQLVGNLSRVAFGFRQIRWRRVAAAAWIVPRPIRDPVYRWVARNRYRIFGRRDSCWLPKPEDADRVL